jgi:hypothetical protein
MRHLWRIGVLLGLASLCSTAKANAQTGGAAGDGQAGATAPGGQSGAAAGGLNGGSAAETPLDSEMRIRNVRKLPPAQQRKSALFNRTTTVRRDTVTSPPPGAGGARASGATARPPAGSVRPYTVQSMRPRDPRVPSDSGWQGVQPPSAPPKVSTRSKVNNFFPSMRPQRHPNANIAPGPGVRRGGMITPYGMMSMMGGAGRARAGRSATSRGASRASATPVPGRR